MLTLLAISGYGRSGKNSAADALIAAGWEHRAFADPLRKVAYDAAILPDGRRWSEVYDELGYEAAKDNVPGFRAALVDIGNSARRHLGPDVWITPALRCIGTKRVVLTDCRFPNEADAVRARGGLVVRVERPGVGPALDKHGDPFESEVALDGYAFDHVVVNDGTLDRLHNYMDALVAVHAAA